MKYNQNTDRFQIRDGGTWLDAGSPGSGGVTSVTECSLDASASSVSGSGDTMVVNFAVTFTAEFLGRHGVRLKAKDDDKAYSKVAWLGAVFVEGSP